jgi:hypothetical protein
MNHFKKIRRSLKGVDIHPKTRSWLHKKRQEEIDLERRLASQIKKATAEGRCTAFIMPKPGSQTMYKSDPPTPGRLCGQPAFRRGYCTAHFVTHFLHLPDRKSGQTGRGVSVRPFAAYQFPIGLLSDMQENLMNDLQRLPMNTSREVCLERLIAEDPAHPLPAIGRTRLTKAKSRR